MAKSGLPPDLQCVLRHAAAASLKAEVDRTLNSVVTALDALKEVLEHPDIQKKPRLLAQAQTESAKAHLLHYEIGGEPVGLQAAIDLVRQALTRTQLDTLEWAGRQEKLGVALLQRYFELKRAGDLPASIAAFRRALSCLPEGSAEWAQLKFDLGLALHTLYKATAELKDLDAGISAYTAASSVFTKDSPLGIRTRLRLGLSLQDRYETLERAADCEMAIQIFGAILDSAPRDSDDWIAASMNMTRVEVTRHRIEKAEATMSSNLVN